MARREGIALRISTLLLATLRERAPMLVAYGRGVYQLGYSAYTPGRDYRWLFPILTPAQRETWLVGLVHHELAHCLEQAETAVPAAAQAVTESAAGQRWHEVLAGRAACRPSRPHGEALERQFAALRAAYREADPGHDTSAELLCNLRQRTPTSQDPTEVGLAEIQQWRARCWQGDKAMTVAPTSNASH